MPKLTGKTWLYVGGGALVLFLLYRWYQNRAAASSGTTDTLGTTTDPNASDYAQLAGQEQGDIAGVSGQEASDVANLQSGLGAATAQESSDVAGLTAGLAASNAQESSDVANLNADVTNLAGEMLTPGDIQGQFNKLFPAYAAQISTLSKELAKVMAGEKKQGGSSKSKTKTHAKTTGRTNSAAGHTNNGQRAGGTARNSVANRSHHPKTTRRRGP